jgi:hypothetical protein
MENYLFVQGSSFHKTEKYLQMSSGKFVFLVSPVTLQWEMLPFSLKSIPSCLTWKDNTRNRLSFDWKAAIWYQFVIIWEIIVCGSNNNIHNSAAKTIRFKHFKYVNEIVHSLSVLQGKTKIFVTVKCESYVWRLIYSKVHYVAITRCVEWLCKYTLFWVSSSK